MPPKTTSTTTTTTLGGAASSVSTGGAAKSSNNSSKGVGTRATNAKITHKELEEYAKKSNGFTAIARDAIDPVYNGDDRLLTMSLWKAAVECAKLGGGKMVMNKHGVAARKAYKTLAAALDVDEQDDEVAALESEYSQKYLRKFAVENCNVGKVSPDAIKAVLDPLDKVLSMAVWRLAIDLSHNKELKNTKILMEAHAQTAKAIYGHLRPLLENAEAEDDDDGAAVGVADNGGGGAEMMQTDDDDADDGDDDPADDDAPDEEEDE